MPNTYKPSYEFMRIRDEEKTRHFKTRVCSLMNTHNLTDKQAELLCFRIDIELSLEFDASPFSAQHYTRKADEYVEDLCLETTTKVKNLVANIEETLVLS